MKLLGRIRTARVYKTLHGRFRIFTAGKILTGREGVYYVLYNNSTDDGKFISIFFQWYLMLFRGYELDHWGAYHTRTLIKKMK